MDLAQFDLSKQLWTIHQKARLLQNGINGVPCHAINRAITMQSLHRRIAERLAKLP